MRRPLAAAGFSAFLCLYLVTLHVQLAPLLLGVALACFAVLLLLRKRVALWNSLCACAAVAVVCGAFLTVQAVLLHQAQYYENREVAVVARCYDLPQRDGNLYVYTLRTEKINGDPVHIKVSAVSREDLDISLYDTVQATMSIEAPDLYGTRVTGEQAKGSFFRGWLPDTVRVTPDSSGFSMRKPMLLLRQKLTDSIRQHVSSGASGVLSGMLTGDKSDMDTQVKSDFGRVGLSHLLAVSGLHLSIWAMSVFTMLSHTRLGRRRSAALSMAFVVGFMTLTGFTPSIQRAGLMMLLYLGAFLFQREADACNSLGGAVLLILLCNPYGAADVGLQLSFLSTLGILVAAPRAAAWYETYLNRVPNAFVRHACKVVFSVGCITFCASVATLPVNLIKFGGISLIAPLANLLVTNVAAFSMILCGIAALAGFFGLEALPALLFVPSGVMGNYIVWITHALAGIPYAYVSIQKSYAAVWLAGTCILLGAAFLLYRRRDGLRRGIRIIAVMSAALLLCCVAAPAVTNHSAVSVYIARGRVPCVAIAQGVNACMIGAGEQGRGYELARQANAYLPDYLYLWQDDNAYDASVLQEYSTPRAVFQQGTCGSRALWDGVSAEFRPQGVSLSINGVTLYMSKDGGGYSGEQLVIAGRADPSKAYGGAQVIDTYVQSNAKHAPNALTMENVRVILLTINASGAVHIREG